MLCRQCPPATATPKTIFFTEVQFQDELLYHRFFAELFLYLYRNPEVYDDWYGVLVFRVRA
jgi:predicted transposase YdaD